jgi:ABC-type glutathione transport system ATPase component
MSKKCLRKIIFSRCLNKSGANSILIIASCPPCWDDIGCIHLLALLSPLNLLKLRSLYFRSDFALMTIDAIPALSIRSLRKVYGSGLVALDGVSLDVMPGDFFALLGPNGAGKSTTIGIISSLVRKSSGTVSIFGQDIDKNFSLAKQCIGVVPQEFNFSVFEKVQNIVVNQAGFYGVPRREAVATAPIKSLEQAQ